MSDAARLFAAHGLGVRFDDLPVEAIDAAKTFVLDTIGVGIAGKSAPLTDNVRSAASRWGGVGPAHLLGGGAPVTAAQAAFVNGFQIHCQEFDCVHEPAVVHPLATILSAMLAEVDQAEQEVSGSQFTVALCVAVDMAASLGVAARSALKFFRPANAGIFGATLGISRLRGFTEQQTVDALGHALAFCSGTMQAHVEGKPVLPLQIANAARGSIAAADLAGIGIPGPEQSINGPYGYFALFEDACDLNPVLEQLGKRWRIAEVSHKPFPTGRAAQGGIVLVQNIRRRIDDVQSISSMSLSAPPLIKRLVGRRATIGMPASYARLCFPYLAATAMVSGSVTLEDFTDSALKRGDVLDLAQGVTVENDGSSDPSAFTPQTLLVTLKDGTTLMETTETLYGSPAHPMTHADHLAKFRNCLAFGFGEERTALADALIEAVDDLVELGDIRELTRLAAGGGADNGR
ncbi:MmgE/PrpD family protein [Parvularcula lutaonensis]|uniref:MmgE/PrpD family protein n=1 Tax=Parvularcula lutaonensis TaxID=491923 RepID=A0ABV7MB26_9PROT|nr:MmgE/PrpD family protein [Parvularcula lutaonensis]GGY38680.1 2-methylcitrate dehydratase [Parvularcula lutaonensis]